MSSTAPLLEWLSPALRTQRKKIVERVAPTQDATVVDREGGTIYGVKIIGFTSKNRRRYTPDALREAIRFYEGVMVNIDHPPKANDPRQARDRFGKLINVRFEEGRGLFGDLSFLTEHDMANRVCEDVERRLGVYGLSHNATGEGYIDDDGVYVVTEITDVRHVDLVADPATTENLTESFSGGRNVTLAQKKKLLIDSIKLVVGGELKKFAASHNLTESKKAKKKKKVAEDDMDDNEDDMEGEDCDEEEDVEEDAEIEPEGGYKVAEDEDEDEMMDDDEEPMKEDDAPTLRKKLKRSRAKEAIRAAGLDPTKDLVEAIAALKPKARTAILSQMKSGKGKGKGKVKSGVRGNAASDDGDGLIESITGKGDKRNLNELANFLMG